METGQKLMTIDQFLMYNNGGSTSAINPSELYYFAHVEPNSFVNSTAYGGNGYYDFSAACGGNSTYYGEGFQVTNNSLIAKTSGTIFVYANFTNSSTYNIYYLYYINGIQVGDSLLAGRYESIRPLTAIKIENGESFQVILSGRYANGGCNELIIRGG